MPCGWVPACCIRTPKRYNMLSQDVSYSLRKILIVSLLLRYGGTLHAYFLVYHYHATLSCNIKEYSYHNVVLHDVRKLKNPCCLPNWAGFAAMPWCIFHQYGVHLIKKYLLSFFTGTWLSLIWVMCIKACIWCTQPYKFVLQNNSSWALRIAWSLLRWYETINQKHTY